MNIGIDHGYYAIKTRHFSFPAGITAYTHEPYTLQNTMEYEGRERRREAGDAVQVLPDLPQTEKDTIKPPGEPAGRFPGRFCCIGMLRRFSA